jgi:MFS family permease
MKICARTTISLAAFFVMVSVVASAQGSSSELLKAAERGDTNRVKALIAASEDVNARTKDGLTCLMKAAWNGHTETVKVLLDAGADVNAYNRRHGWTALKIASWGGHTAIVKALLAAGAYVNIDTGASYSPSALRYAEKYGHTQIVELLKKAESNPQNVQEQKKAATKRHSFDFLKVIWVLLWAVPSALIASHKNRSVLRWLIIGSIFGPFGLIVIAFPMITKPGEKPLSLKGKYIKLTGTIYLIASFVGLLGGAFLLHLIYGWGDLLDTFDEAEKMWFVYGGIVLILMSLLAFFKFLRTRRLQEDEIPGKEKIRDAIN